MVRFFQAERSAPQHCLRVVARFVARYRTMSGGSATPRSTMFYAIECRRQYAFLCSRRVCPPFCSRPFLFRPY